MSDSDVLLELKRIREALDALPLAMVDAIYAHLVSVETVSAPASGCAHETRVALGGGDWECADCQHRQTRSVAGVS